MCGIIGIIGTDEAAKEAYLGLCVLQHRGQDGAGIVTFDSQREIPFQMVKGLGLVEKAIPKDALKRLTGSIAVGHTRYSTVGSSSDERNLQPMLLNFPLPMSFCHNGNVINYFSLKDELRRKTGWAPLSNNDLEIIMQIFVQNLLGKNMGVGDGGCQEEDEKPHQLQVVKENGVGVLLEEGLEDDLILAVRRAVKAVLQQAIGGYAVVTSILDRYLIGYCDVNGIRPLVVGKKLLPSGKTAYALASETNALHFLGYDVLDFVKGGELLIIDGYQAKLHRILLPKQEREFGDKKAAACMFEWVYFSAAESSLQGLHVYQARLRLGELLALEAQKYFEVHGVYPDLVSPIPETSRSAALSVAEKLNLPYRECLVKNRYVQRSFIMGETSDRKRVVDLKLSPIRSEIEGKSILLVDDSIVRGTTLKRIVEIVRNSGAKKIFVASTCPPIKYGCYYGIDFPDPKQLLANQVSWEKIAEYLDVDGVIYLSLQGLKQALKGESMCMACLTGEYPAGEQFIDE
ncbi:MAG: amidophosphoribosyltransferase, partial [Bdellovibrionaceae bacterium]|nr:amidophosphoribosyltransferase [Pseudobdellovibrionaceae bacterium]